MDKKLTVLLTNDDGFHADGIKILHSELIKRFNVIVAAPEQEKSGVGHAFTFNNPLHCVQNKENESYQGYIVSGTPADCVKFAIGHLLPEKPDIVVSGINNGENSGLSAFYSGTVAAAREGAFWNIPSFAFSVCAEAFAYAKEYASIVPSIIENVLKSGNITATPRVYYNVNFPGCSLANVKSTKITWQSLSFFDDRYRRIESKSHKSGEGFVVFGEKKDIENSDAFDSKALTENIITITPLTFDSTAHQAIPHLLKLEKEDFLRGDLK
jgi:5'-nucleotidase